jgi:hypothetical protein
LGLLACGIGGAWKWSGLGDAGAEREARFAKARELGIALTLDDLRKLTTVPDDRNGAAFYVRVMPDFDNSSATGKRLRELTSLEKYGLTPSELGEADRLLKGLDASLKSVEKGSRRPALDFHRRWEEGYDMALPEPRVMNYMARALGLRVMIRCAKDDPDAALEDVATMLRMSKQLFTEPAGVSYYAGFTIEQVALSHLAVICQQNKANKPLLKRALALVVDQPYPDIRFLIRGGMAQDLQTIKLFANGEFESNEFASARVMRFNSVRNAVESLIVDRANQAIQALPDDPNDIQSVCNALVAQEEKIDSSQDLVSNLAWIVSSAWAFFDERYRAIWADRQVAKAALTLMIKGRPYPAQVADLPLDPYSGRPLSYLKEGKGFAIYSWGTNRIDDRGTSTSDMPGTSITDLVWRVPYRASRLKRPEPSTTGIPAIR